MSETISSSFYLEPGSRLIEFSCEIIPETQKIVRGVQYSKNLNTGEERIVDSISQKPIFILSNNPGVTELKDNPDIRKAYHIRVQTPGNELSAVYVIDLDTNNVYSTSHVFFRYTTDLGDIKTCYILGASPDSYINIISFLKNTGAGEYLMVKLGNDWEYFNYISTSKLISKPEEENPTEED